MIIDFFGWFLNKKKIENIHIAMLLVRSYPFITFYMSVSGQFKTLSLFSNDRKMFTIEESNQRTFIKWCNKVCVEQKNDEGTKCK